MRLSGRPIGAQIAQLRINQGLTRQQAAEAAGINLQVWQRIEDGRTSGHYPNPHWNTIVQMLKGLGMTIDFAFTDSAGQAPAEPAPLPLYSAPSAG